MTALDPRRLQSRTLVAVAAVAALWPTSALAYRPFNGTDAAVAGRGEVELEVGPLGFVEEGPNRAIVAPSAVVNWGFARRLELVLEARHLVQLRGELREPRFRIEDTAISVKGVLREGSLQEKKGPSIALESSALLPTLNGTSALGGEAALIASQRWADLTLHLDGAAAWTRSHRLGLFGGAILEVHDAWPLRPVTEVFVQRERDRPTEISGLLGAIWRVNEALSLDTGVRVARAGGMATTEVRAGLTWGVAVGVPR